MRWGHFVHENSCEEDVILLLFVFFCFCLVNMLISLGVKSETLNDPEYRKNCQVIVPETWRSLSCWRNRKGRTQLEVSGAQCDFCNFINYITN